MQQFPNPTPYPTIEQYDPRIIVFYLQDSTDHRSPKTGLAASAAVKLIKGDGTIADPTNSVAEIGRGWYKIALTKAETAVPGDFVISVSATGADPVNDRYTIMGTPSVNRMGWVFSDDTGSVGSPNGYQYTYNPKK